jgi:hypothetical protein
MDRGSAIKIAQGPTKPDASGSTQPVGTLSTTNEQGLNRRNFWKAAAGVVATAAAGKTDSFGQGPANAFVSSPQTQPPTVTRVIQDRRLAALLLGYRPIPCPPKWHFSRQAAETAGFEVVKLNGNPYAVVPTSPGSVEIDTDMLVFGGRGYVSPFNSPDSPTSESTRLRLHVMKQPMQGFVMMAYLVTMMKCFRTEFPDAKTCKVVIGRFSPNPRDSEGTAVRESNSFDLQSTPEFIEDHLKKITAGLKKDRENIENKKTREDCGIRAMQLALLDRRFEDFFRTAGSFSLLITKETLKDNVSKLTVQGCIHGNSGDGVIDRKFTPQVAIVSEDIFKKASNWMAQNPP